MPKLKFPPLRSFVIGGNTSIDRIMQQKGFEIARGLSGADIVIFQGGEDVSPYLYGDERHETTHSNERRDRFEFACYKASKGKLKLGICRGGQFLNVMNGGNLFQNVDGHAAGPHDVRYVDSNGARSITKFIRVTSTHHQMIRPNMRSAEIWSTASCSGIRETGELVDLHDPRSYKKQYLQGDHNSDVEVCWYPSTRSLCFQPHPEYNSHETREMFFDCIRRTLEA